MYEQKIQTLCYVNFLAYYIYWHRRLRSINHAFLWAFFWGGHPTLKYHKRHSVSLDCLLITE